MAEEKEIVKQKIKDSVFCDLFGEPEYQYKLYQYLHPEDTTVTIDDFKTVTIQNVLSNQLYNDLGFMARNKMMILVEAQSRWSINIIPRIIMYYGETLNRYIDETKQKRYGRRKLYIPRPEFYVLYTGTDEKIVNEIYSFAEEFFGGDDSFIEVKVKVLQASEDGTDIVSQYVKFTRILTEQEGIHGRTREAIIETIKICKEQNILKEYLGSKETEVIGIMLSLYDQEKATKDYGDERENEGEIKGAIKFARNENWTNEQIVTYLKDNYQLSDDEVSEYLQPAMA